MSPPVIGITVGHRDDSAESGKYELSIAYSRAVAVAGGLSVLLPHEPEHVARYVQMCDGLILTGGSDPDTTAFGQPLHALARVMDSRRQAFEVALLDEVKRAKPQAAVLGVCLGMQLMALHAGGTLNQYLPDTLADAAVHQDDQRHPVVMCVSDSVLGAAGGRGAPGGPGEVVSSHQQAVADAGSMRVIARAADDVIEAIDAPDRAFYVGVQWHPERGGDEPLSLGLIANLIRAARSAT